MSRLYACVGKVAAIPYPIIGGRVRVYSIEELCYCICDMADLLSDDFMQMSLVEYIENELELKPLGAELRSCMAGSCTIDRFCESILNYACYLKTEQRQQVLQHIRENADLPVIERLKRQAAAYVEDKSYFNAQKAYRDMLLLEEVQRDASCMAYIYARLGDVSAGMFHFDTASYCFKKSNRLEESPETKKKYLLCQRFLMSREKYLEWISEREEYYALSVDVETEYEKALSEIREEEMTLVTPEALQEEFCHMALEKL